MKYGSDWLTVIIFAHQIPQPEEGIGYDDGSPDRFREYPPLLAVSEGNGNGRKELEHPPPMTLESPECQGHSHTLASQGSL